MGKGMGEEFTTQRATKVAAGGLLIMLISVRGATPKNSSIAVALSFTAAQ
jgi:hypothetical protein